MDRFSSHSLSPGMKHDRLDDRLHDDNLSVRSNALDDLRDQASPHVIAQAAAPLLADPDPGLRERASRLLATLSASKIAAQAVAPYIHHANIATRNLAGEVLVELGRPAVDALVPFLRHDDPDARKFAIDLLAQLPAEDATDDIAAALRDDDANVRLAAVDALGALRATEHADALRALYDREPIARPDIIHAMGAFEDEAHLDVLERGLNDDHPVVQLASAEALASQNDPAVVALLLDRIEDVDPMARPIIVHSIVELCTNYPQYRSDLPATMKGYLLEMLGDADPTYQCAAARGLRWFTDDALYEDMLAYAGRDDELDMALFTTLLNHDTPFVPLHRATTAGLLSPPVAAPFAVGLMAQDALADPDYEQIGAFLQRHFDALSVDDKLTTISLCKQIGHPELQGIIRVAEQDANDQVQSLAADTAIDSPTPYHDSRAL